MAAYPRYRFDQGFGARIAPPVRNEPAVAVDPLDVPRHSERALQAALAEARGGGLADGLTQGRQEGEALACRRIEAGIATALDGLSARLMESDATHAAVMDRLEGQGALLLVALVRRLASRLLDHVAQEAVERLAGEALRAAGTSPVLRLRVHPSLGAALEERLAGQAIFRGRLEILPDGSLAPGALDAAWEAGGVRRDPAALDAAIDAMADRALSALAPPLMPSPAPGEGDNFPDTPHPSENAPCPP